MHTGQARHPRVSDRCLDFVFTTPSLVFPISMAVVSVMTFLTKSPSIGIVGLLGLALAPWALIAGSIRVPPMVVIGVTLVPTAILVVAYDDQAALFLGVVACTWAAAEGLRSPTLFALVGFSAASFGCSWVRDWEAGGWAIWITGMLFGVFAGSLLHRQNVLTGELDVARRDLDLAAVEHERKAIAREVHDIVGHSLTVVLLNIAGARRNLSKNPAAAADALERAESISRDSLETVRSVVTLLSSGDESQRNAPLPGGADVTPLLEQAQRSGMPIQVTIDGDPRALEPSIGLTLVRLLQESLANASRHAPGEGVEVAIRISDRCALLTVSNALPATVRLETDDRVGIGVAGMNDRVAAVNGSIYVGPADGCWTVRVSLPRAAHRSPELSAPSRSEQR